jgi:hypothetical protein
MNRVFKSSGKRPTTGRPRFVDMTTTALKCGHALTLWIEGHLVRNYYIPTHPDDDGTGLVTALLDDFHSALAEEVPALLVSHGDWISVEWRLVKASIFAWSALPAQVAMG